MGEDTREQVLRAVTAQAWARGEEWARETSAQTLAALLNELSADDSAVTLRQISRDQAASDCVCRLAMLALQELVYRTRPVRDGGGV